MTDTYKPPARVAAEMVLGNTALALIARVSTPILLGVAAWIVTEMIALRHDMVRLQAAFASGVDIASTRRENDLGRLTAVEARVGQAESALRVDREELVAQRHRIAAIEDIVKRGMPGGR